MRNLILYLILIGITTIFPFADVHGYEAARMPSTEPVMEVNTIHFRILYQQSLVDTVPDLVRACEEAWYVLNRIVAWTPADKITVLYLDAIDTHNGWADPVAHNTMAVYAAGSEQGSSIYQPGNELRRTVFHELMHLFSMDRRSGYNAALSGVFGKVNPVGDPLSFLLTLATASPNMLAPRWYLEGQAIWAESEFAGPGRGQSTLVDMILRCQVHDNTLMPPSRWYIETPCWPYGASAYIYGMRMMQYLYENSEKENPVGDIARNVSQSILFGFDNGVRRTTDKPWKLLAADMLKQENIFQQQQLAQLETLPLSPAPRLTAKDLSVSQVLFSGGQVYLLASDESDRPGLYVYDPAGSRIAKIRPVLATPPFGVLSASADDHRIYYTRMDIQQRENMRYEVRVFDVLSGSDALVTRQGRYRSIDVSPDGRSLAAVSHRAGKAYLIETPLTQAGRPDKEQILAQMPPGIDLAAARYSPNGHMIVYTQADKDGFKLNLYDRSTNRHRTLWRSRTMIIAPTWHPDGSNIVFGSDLNGVYNLYKVTVSGEKQPVPLTHVRGGLFFPSFSADGSHLAAVGFDGNGSHLTIVPYASETLAGKTLPVIHPRWPEGKLATLKQEARARQDTFTLPSDQMPHETYNSFTSIRPDFWTPWFTASTFGVQGGLAAVFSDPTQRQELFLSAGAESEYGSPLVNAVYTYRFNKAQVTLSGSANQLVYPDLLTERNSHNRFDYAEETRSGAISLSIPLWHRLEHQLTANLGYKMTQREGIDEAEQEYKGVALETLPSEDDESSIWAQLVYFSGTVFNRSVSVEDGSMVAAGLERSQDSLGGEIDATRLRVDASQYLCMPYLKNHVLKLSGTYVRGWGDETAQGLFGLGGFGMADLYPEPGVGRTLGLRGYDANFLTGREAVRAIVSYRFPIWNIYKGAESWFPVYARSLFAEVYYEGGKTWNDGPRQDDIDWLNAAGLEVNFGGTLFRFLQFAPGLGVVYAPQRDEFDEEKNEVVAYMGIKLWYNF